MSRWIGGLSALTLLVLALGAVEGHRVKVVRDSKPRKARANPALEYESFHEAIAFFDLDAAEARQQGDDQRAYARAVRALIAGNQAGAETALEAVRDANGDPSLRALATNLLAQLRFAENRFEEFLQIAPDDDPSDPFRVMARAATDAAPQRIRFPVSATSVETSRDAGLPTLQVSVNGCTRAFVLDTGAPFSLVNSDVARECGVAPIGDSRGTIRNEVSGRPASIGTLKLGEVVVENHPVMIVPTADMTIEERPSPNKTMDGVLGWPLIRRMAFRIDFGEKRARVSRPGASGGSRNFFFYFRPIVVAEHAGGRPLHFMLDTGMEATQLFNRIGKKIPLGKKRRANVGVRKIGSIEKLQAWQLPKFRMHLGEHRLDFESIVLLPGSFSDGILGSDVYAADRLLLDFGGGRFELNP